MKKFLNSLFLMLMALTLMQCSSEVKLLKPSPFSISQSSNAVAPILEKVPLSAAITFKPRADNPLAADAEFKITIPTQSPGESNGFRTQALPLGNINFVKIEVTGIGIGTPLWANGADGAGLVPNVGGTFSLIVSNVPYGNARVATVTAYDVSSNPIPGAVVKATFNVNSAATSVELFFRQTPSASVVQAMFGSTPNDHTATTMSLANLQTLIDNITGLGGSSPNYTYTTHPSLLNTAQIATDLLAANGNALTLNPANAAYKITPGSVQFSITGLIGADTADFNVQDPASSTSTALGNGGPYTINNVTPGTWKVLGSAIGYVPDSVPNATVGAGATVNVGTINFSVAAAPTITSLSAGNGVVGASININGTNFHPSTGGNTVKFGTTTATVTAATTTQLTVTVPAGIFGTQAVTVTVGGQVSNSNNFDVTPNISGLSVGSGIIGASINVNGSGFDPTSGNNTVKIGATSATVTAATNTQLTITVPTSADGNVTVQVGSQTSNGVAFQVLPTISITAPAAAAIVNGISSAITTSFTSGNSVSQVEFFLDGVGGTSLGTDNTGPTYSLNWNTTLQTSGAHTLVARITDSASHQATSTVINITIDQPPSITSLTPNTGTAPGLSFPVKLDVSATDDVTSLVSGNYTWSCTANCGDSSFNATTGTTVYWTAPSTNQGAAATIQVSVNDGVNAPVTSTVNLNYQTGTASTTVVGVSNLDEVSTYAGSTLGNTNSTLLLTQFNKPLGLDFDSAGNLYVVSNHAIRKIRTNGIVTTLAGQPGTAGFNNATGTAARFNDPGGLVVDSLDNVFVVDEDNHRIRKITPAGVVTTFAGNGSEGYADHVTGTSAEFNNPRGIAIDSSDNLYIADSDNDSIRKITPAGVVTTLAGDGNSIGFVDGTGAAAQFSEPVGLAVDSAGNVYVADEDNHAIRKVTPGGVVTTLAGNGVSGFADGTGAGAQFNLPEGIAVDAAGNVYVGDTDNHVIRKITAGGVVTTLAGSRVAGFADGLKNKGKFNSPSGLAIDTNGLLYVADSMNHRIRRIKP